ncbi:unnamed protein product [Heterosigma akashiwo]|mmetsp:Transcript_11744/g.16351  ORF Transcript_11744/g.16351 Transcript_11744/m.16351 type:complete len:214 (+) Transcript_11744:22-663(+)
MVALKNKCVAAICVLNEMAGFALLVCGAIVAADFNKYADADVDLSDAIGMLYIVPGLYIMVSNIASLFGALKDEKAAHGSLAGLSALAIVALAICLYVQTYVLLFGSIVCDITDDCTVDDDLNCSYTDDTSCCITQTTKDFCDETMPAIGAGYTLLWTNMIISIITSITACVYCCCPPGGAKTQQPQQQMVVLQQIPAVAAVKVDEEGKVANA